MKVRFLTSVVVAEVIVLAGLFGAVLLSPAPARADGLSLPVPVSVQFGGTGQQTLTSGSFLVGNGTGSVSLLAPPISVANGGTGSATLTSHAVLIGNGTSALTTLSLGNNGDCLISGGAGADPAFGACTAGGTFSNPTISGTCSTVAGKLGFASSKLCVGDGSVSHNLVSEDQAQTLSSKTMSSPTLSGTMTGGTISGAAIDAGEITTGTLSVSRGGTGAGSLSSNTCLVGNGTSSIQQISSGYGYTCNTAAVSLSTAAAYLAANTTTGAQNNYTTMASLSLAAGTWRLVGHATCFDGGAGAIFGMIITDGTNFYGSSRSTANAANNPTVLTASGVATLAGTTTISLEVADGSSGNGICRSNDTGAGKDTGLTALRAA